MNAVAERVQKGPFDVGAEGFGAEVRVAEGAGGGEMGEDLVRRLVRGGLSQVVTPTLTFL